MRFLRSARCLTLAALSLTALPALAQSPAQRQQLLTFHATISDADAPTVAALLATPTAKGEDRELTRLRRAFLLLRQGELDSSSKILRKAGEEFYNVTARHNDWPLAWYGIGLTERALARRNFPVRPARFHPLGADYNQGAIQAFVYALEKDSTMLAAAEGLADAVQATTRWGYTGKARDALRKTALSSSQILLVRGRLERADNNRERAIDLFERAIKLGGDSGVAYLELARDQFAVGRDSAAMASYWQGVRSSRSEASVQMLREQLMLIAGPGELRGFDSLSTPARTDLVNRFWTIRDVDAGVAPGDRLKEHYRRYEYANLAFRPRNQGMTAVRADRATRMAAVFGYGTTSTTYSTSDHRYPTYGFYGDMQQPYLVTATPKSAFGLDDQSTMVRPGASGSYLLPAFGGIHASFPAAIAGRMLYEIDSESGAWDSRGVALMRYGRPSRAGGNLWVYHRAEGDLIVPVNGWAPGTPCDVVTRYCAWEMRGYLRPEEADGLRRELLAGRDAMLATDRMIRHFPNTLTPAVDAYAMVDGGTGEGRILVALAIPAGEITPDSTHEGFIYPVRIQLIAAPPSGAYRVERDTTRLFRTERRLEPGEYLQAVEVLPVAPADYHLRVVVQTLDGTRGSVGGDDTVVVSSIRRGVALSDLVLGKEGSGLSWWSGTDRLRLNPSGRIRRDEPLYLYYQLGGLPLGRGYSTALEVYHATKPDEQPLISLAYDEIADQPVMEFQRVIDLRQLDAGVHTLRVTIRDQEGRPLAQRHASVRVE